MRTRLLSCWQRSLIPILSSRQTGISRSTGPEETVPSGSSRSSEIRPFSLPLLDPRRNPRAPQQVAQVAGHADAADEHDSLSRPLDLCDQLAQGLDPLAD